MHIKNAMLQQSDPHQDFHAWIQLDADDLNSEILDITGMHWEEIETPNGYFDRQTALSHQIEHFAVLTDEQHIHSYHASLVYNHIIHFGSPRQQKSEIIWYLTNFSQQQNVSIDRAIGYTGHMILDERGKNHTRGGLWSKFLQLFKS
ncbi:hypothetical protein [Shewanella violacea]|nr:hypothetical protein [Shewanella violacea]